MVRSCLTSSDEPKDPFPHRLDVVRRGRAGRVGVVRAERREDAPVRVERRVRARMRLQPLLARFTQDVPDDAQHRREELVARRLTDHLVEARVLFRVRLVRRDPALLYRERLGELIELRLRDALRGERGDRRLDESAELNDVGQRVAARHERLERPREIVRRGLAHERPASCARLDDAEQLERAERFADGRARYLETVRELTLGRQLVARLQIALLEERLDLLDDPFVEAAAPDRFDDGQLYVLRAHFWPFVPASVGWSGGQTRRPDQGSAPRREPSTRAGRLAGR